MRIVYIIPGPAGPFFEKNSLREQALVAELRWCGHDVLFVPVLFPLNDDTPTALSGEADLLPIGAVRLYARQSLPTLSRHAPEWVWRAMDRPFLRKHVIKRVMGSPKRFNEFIKDALDGRNGALSTEIENLSNWLRAHKKPDVVYLSTPFLLGVAPMMKKALRVPIACAMNSELDEISHLRGPDAIIMLTKLRSAVSDADGFIPVSNFHSERVQRRLGIATSATRPVHPGIYVDDIPVAPPPETAAIGVIVREGGTPSAISPAIAVSVLKQPETAGDRAIRVALEASPLRTSRRRHDEGVVRGVTDAGGSVETLPRNDIELRTFLASLDVAVFIHPEQPPSFDFAVLEALACGVPVLLPDTGANREIAGLSDAVFLYGSVYEMGAEAAKLSAASSEEKATLRRTARSSVEHCFSMPRMAHETAEALQTIISRNSPPPETWPRPAANGMT